MDLKCVTISGANEHTDIKELTDLLYQYPQAEIGIQVSDKKAAYDSKRYEWFFLLYDYVKTLKQNINVALHINPGWVEKVCEGYIPAELFKMMMLKNPDGGLFVKRLQLNFKIGRDQIDLDCARLRWVTKHFYHHRFILSYNEANKEFIDQFYFTYGPCFDLLYDESHGEGKPPQQWQPAAYSDVVQGYSGGLSPENISSELTKIALLNVGNTPTWVDAEGNLKGADGHLSLEKAEAYLKEASRWCH